MKGSGIRGFICLEELQVVHLERNKVTGYWMLADMRDSYGRACTVASSGTRLHTKNRLVIEILHKSYLHWLEEIRSLAIRLLQTYLQLSSLIRSDRMPD